MHVGHHQLTFVAFSILVAVLGSWTALDLQRQVWAHSGRIRACWLAGASLAMGLSIFSMHFIAMLGFDAGMPVRYDLGLTVGSLLLAVAATSFAFVTIQASEASRLRVMIAALAMGTGIASMHYVGMAALRLPASLSYDPWLVGASFGIAVFVSWAALSAVLSRPSLELRLVGAGVLGLAICSMHYTAMAAAHFEPTHEAVAASGGLDQLSLALWVGTGTILLLFFALISAMFDRRFEAMALREAAAVQAREAHLREVVTRMPLAVAVVRRSGRSEVSLANPAAEELLGQTPPSDLPLYDLDGRRLERDEHPFAQAIRDGATFAGTLVALKRATGETRYLELSAAPLPAIGADEEGSEGEVILAAQDVTSRLETEQALRQAQKLETIGQLTGGVAHDFNNLLTPIIGGLDLLRRDTSMNERAQRVVDGALQASNRAATLVQRLLAFSRRQNLQPRIVEMGALLEGIRDLIKPSIGPKIEVRIEIAPEAGEKLLARVDPGQLELAILNLAVNARDAMPDGGVLTISASAEELTNPKPGSGLWAGRYVKLCVRDTGVGMDQATLRRAVEPFFSTKGPGKGTGLGLSIVHGLAAQSNGALLLSSKAGEGTKAELWLPLAEEEADATDAPKAKSGSAAPATTILLVEDEELVRIATAEMLRSMGHEVIEASSGAEAMRFLERGSGIALVISDYLMPAMTGMELASEIGERHPGTPVLIITGYGNPEELPAHLPRLSKPFTGEQLQELVSRLLTRSADNVVPIGERRSK